MFMYFIMEYLIHILTLMVYHFRNSYNKLSLYNFMTFINHIIIYILTY